MNENLYEVLGVPENATKDQIKKAYKQKAKKLHPDVGGDEDGFKELNHSYEILSDDKKRQEYDHRRNNPQQVNNGFDGFGGFNPFSNIVNDFFNRQQRSNSEARLTVPLKLSEVLNGGQKRIVFDRRNTCNDCKGSGREKTELCPTCNGIGMVSNRQQRGNSIFETVGPCYHCRGNGYIISGGNCPKCEGRGFFNEHQDFMIDVPIGVPYDVGVKLDGKGHNNGDLFIIFVADSSDIYDRHGDDLVGILELSYPEMVLGHEKTINVISQMVKVKINKLSKPADKIRLKGLGMPNYHNNTRGDLFLILKLKELTELTDKETELLSALQQEKNFKS